MQTLRLYISFLKVGIFFTINLIINIARSHGSSNVKIEYEYDFNKFGDCAAVATATKNGKFIAQAETKLIG